MRLPPLNALRAFEAAARHGGFIGAAEELHVSRGAISRHVKILEDQIGIALFTRGANGVALTPEGRTLLPILTDAFSRIRQGVDEVSATKATLRIICPPAMSVRWLLPRLPDFRARHPDLRLSVTTDFFGDRGFDGVDYEIGLSVERPLTRRPPNMRTAPLLPYLLTPACSPAYLDQHGPFSTPDDLARCTLLLETGKSGDWQDWCQDFAPALDTARGDRFPNFDLATKAATMGAGMLMADLALCREEIDLGTLVLPFPDLVCDSPRGWFCLVTRSDLWDRPDVAAFRAWATECAARDRAEIFAESA